MENTDASTSKKDPDTSKEESDKEMEEVFQKMEEHGNNTVDNLIKWMKEAKIVIDNAGEEAARVLFEGAEKGKVKAEEFNEVLEKTAEKQSRDISDFMKQLKTGGKKFVEALKAGAHAFEEYMEEQKNEEK